MPGYAFAFDGHGTFTPDGRAEIADVDAHNAAIESAELDHWATKPELFAAYEGNAGQITTWRGVTIGRVVASSTYRNNLGAKIRNVRVRGTNGAVYYGSYGCDWSQLVRLRKVKGN